jgi:Phytanoyl-CoA dioxygenase (PhyH)
MNAVPDVAPLSEQGWIRIRDAAPVGLCRRLVEVLERELEVPIHDPARWAGYGGEERDLVPIWGHQAQWDIRQHPRMHRIWSQLWGTERLWVSLDSCRFTPPWRDGYNEPHGIHWDHDPWDDSKGFLQGVLALADTAADQGGFRCVPSLWQDRGAWPRQPVGAEEWLAITGGREIVHVEARAGDLIVWDSRLPHGNSKNRSGRPRVAFYISMGPVGDEPFRQANVESWRTGRCVPWWRDRPGYDRTEPWPPARLTETGRKLLGLDDW